LELFQSIDMSPETFEFRAYTRIKQLQHLLQTRQINQEFYWSSREPQGTQDAVAARRTPVSPAPTV
jgi:hypothetical protein